MSTPPQISVDYDVLRRHATALDGLAARVTSAIEAGGTTGGLDAAHAFGLLCAGMNIPATLVTGTVTGAMGSTREHLHGVADAVRGGIRDFEHFDSTVAQAAESGIAAIDDVPRVG